MGNLNLKYKDGGSVPEGVGLLISILLRYPEVCSVHYLQELHALKFTFMVLDSKVMSLEAKLSEALEVFHLFDGQEMRCCDVKYQTDERVTTLMITRDVESMTQKEVGLIVELVKREHGTDLVQDEPELGEDELIFQEEIISHMLATIRTSDMDKNVIAMREEGRVLVFRN